ncbi:PTS system IID component, Man family [Lacrimispora sphenoides]|uniref:PTS system, mannose-specific IID component n=1 Tax=Lacrimispora sphenoides JCM 1415 TaxID=1297793 RepID=A0ABY1C6V7_9FIRM|nr:MULTISPECIES: PTS system mannose/fructose/sorbose family transporter subunit IID [Lacrimispora]SET74960.1 PTS system, mannose-specific IID component [[Clostridium] sphenoides JCM 1415]SEU30741.1 PTS system IID component, Man family [Lacrimispora sphenoides]SUY50974.1 PTS system mannose/fructose/sorbose family transporter subunit IID [Lacrimispora sphenoides]
MKNKRENSLLNKKDINKAAWSYIFFIQATQNFERMMGLAFCHVLEPILKKLYKNDSGEYKKSLQRHMQFFNTEPQLGALIPGITIAMEEARAMGEDVSEELIVNTKNALMGPFAGIGDSMLIGTYSPILLSIAMSMCISDGNPVGPLFFCAVWLTSVVGLQWYLFHKGYDMGIGAANLFFTNRSLADKITTGLTMMGLIVIGGVAATTVKANVVYQFVSGEMSLSLQEQIFDKIMPGILPLLLTLAVWYLMDKKKWSATKIILGIVAFTAVMVFLGIM